MYGNQSFVARASYEIKQQHSLLCSMFGTIVLLVSRLSLLCDNAFIDQKYTVSSGG